MSPTSYRTAPPRVSVKKLHHNTPDLHAAGVNGDSVVNRGRENVQNLRRKAHVREHFYRQDQGTPFANNSSMSALAELLLVLTSIGLSVALARLAVGEMFRLVRITSRPPSDPNAQ